MEKKSSDIFLYLLGAGASCNTLPLASDFAEKLSKFADMLSGVAGKQRSTGYDAKQDKIIVKRSDSNPLWAKPCSEFIKAVKWLAREASYHASIDTFAKKLYFKKDRQNLKRLKVVLSAYLIAEQNIKNVDFRYDSFFASICEFDGEGHVCLPPNLRIITWNYDAQLEKAFYGFCENEELVLKNITYNRRQIRRINGCCGQTLPNRIDKYFSAIWDSSPDAGLEAAIRLHEEYMNIDCQAIPDICFSWEKEQRSFNSLLEDLNEVSVLVVIGYSFPYFNREMDEKIFKNFGSNIKKIYLQSPENTYDAVEKRLMRLVPPILGDEGEPKINRINSKDSFFIPDEF